MVLLLFTCTLLSPFPPGICVCPPPWPVDVLEWPPPFSRVLWLSTMLTTCPRGAWSNPYRNAPSSFWDRLSKQEQKGHSLIEKRINKETQHVGADFFFVSMYFRAIQWMTESKFFTLGRNQISGRKNIWPTETEAESTNYIKFCYSSMFLMSLSMQFFVQFC